MLEKLSNKLLVFDKQMEIKQREREYRWRHRKTSYLTLAEKQSKKQTHAENMFNVHLGQQNMKTTLVWHSSAELLGLHF